MSGGRLWGSPAHTQTPCPRADEETSRPFVLLSFPLLFSPFTLFFNPPSSPQPTMTFIPFADAHLSKPTLSVIPGTGIRYLFQEHNIWCISYEQYDLVWMVFFCGQGIYFMRIQE